MRASGLSISEAAEAAGVTRKAIRLYESKGLLEQPARTPAGYRVFDEADVQVLTFIRRARLMGLHLQDIAELLEMSREGKAPCGWLSDRLDERLAEVDQAIVELEGLRRSLRAARERARVGVADADALICPVVEQA